MPQPRLLVAAETLPVGPEPLLEKIKQQAVTLEGEG
jgi:hypothetical protein